MALQARAKTGAEGLSARDRGLELPREFLTRITKDGRIAPKLVIILIGSRKAGLDGYVFEVFFEHS